MQESFLYVAQGKIHLKKGSAPAQVIESKFGQSLIDRNSQIRQRNAWKTEGTGAKFMSGGILWRQPDQENEIPVVINAISRVNSEGEVLYSLSTNEIGGVFRIAGSGDEERRLLHTADFRVGHLSSHPSDGRIACEVRTREGVHIAVMQGDGRELTDVTQGDSLDLCPTWIPDGSGDLLFQSAGIARNAAGMSMGVSASRIERLKIETGEITTILADEKFDYLQPRMASDGTLYCIRRPYHSPKQTFHPLRAALDLVLLPFRLLFAVFQFANFFTMRYTGNTLVSSSGVRQRQPDLRQMLMTDNLSHAMRTRPNLLGRPNDWKAPNSWALIQCGPDHDVQVIEKGVLTFDLLESGSLLLSDGKRVWVRDARGDKEELAKDEFISQVLAFSQH